jgi:hypothetical protein
MEKISLVINKVAYPMTVSIYKGKFMVKEHVVSDYKPTLDNALNQSGGTAFDIIKTKKMISRIDGLFKPTKITIEEKT